MVGRRHEGGGTANSKGPLGSGGRRAREGREGSLVGRSEGRQPAAGWAAKPGASGRGGGRVVPARGGGDGGQTTVETSCRCGTSSVGRRVDGAAAGVGSGWGVPAGGGRNVGGVALVASCGIDTSSMGRRAGRAAAGADSGREEAAPWGSGWQAAIASRS